MNKKKLKNYLLQVLKVGFGVGIFAYFVASGRIDLVKVQHAFLHSRWTLLALLMAFGSIMACSTRWWLLIRSQGVEIGYLQGLKLVLIGWFFNVTIPGTISGDVVKVYYITKHSPDRKMAAGFSVLMDRLIGLMVLITVTFTAVLVNYSAIKAVPELKLLGQGVVIVFAGLCVALLLFYIRRNAEVSQRWPSFLKNMIEAFWAYRNEMDKVVIAVMLTVLNFCFTIMIYYSAMQALGESTIPLAQYFFLIPLGLFVMAIPIAPAGLGIGQGVFLKLFAWAYGSSVTVGADMTTIAQLVIISWAVVGMVVYILYRHEEHEPSPVMAVGENVIQSERSE